MFLKTYYNTRAIISQADLNYGVLYMFDFEKYLVPGVKGHLIGIGGVSMSPLAEVLHDAGLCIVGSDMHEGDNTRMLRDKGIQVTIAILPITLRTICSLWFALPLCMTITPKFRKRIEKGSLFLSALRHGAPLCASIPTRSALQARTARRRPLPCAHIS